MKRSYIKLLVLTTISFMTNCKVIEGIKAKHSLLDESPMVRARGLEILYNLGDKNHYKTVCRYIYDRSPIVRMKAISILGKWKSKECLDKLLHKIEDEDIRVALEAIHAIGNIGGEKSTQKLLHLIFNLNPLISSAARGELEKLKISPQNQIKLLAQHTRDTFIQRIHSSLRTGNLDIYAKRLAENSTPLSIATLKQLRLKAPTINYWYGYGLGLASTTQNPTTIINLLNHGNENIIFGFLDGALNSLIFTQDNLVRGELCKKLKDSTVGYGVSYVIVKHKINCPNLLLKEALYTNFDAIFNLFLNEPTLIVNDKVIFQEVFEKILRSEETKNTSLLLRIAQHNLLASIFAHKLTPIIKKVFETYLYESSYWVSREKLKSLFPDLEKEAREKKLNSNKWIQDFLQKTKNLSKPEKIKTLLEYFPEKKPPPSSSLLPVTVDEDKLLETILAYSLIRANLNDSEREMMTTLLLNIFRNELSYWKSLDIISAILYIEPSWAYKFNVPLEEEEELKLAVIAGELSSCNTLPEQKLISLTKEYINNPLKHKRELGIKALSCLKTNFSKETMEELKPLLIKTLEQYSDGELILILGEILKDEIIEPIDNILRNSFKRKDDEEKELIKKVLITFGKIKDNDKVKKLLEIYSYHPDIEIRLEALDQLHNIGEKDKIAVFKYDYYNIIRQKVSILLNEK